MLAFDIMNATEIDGLLSGYSAPAIVGGCMQFAASALRAEISYNRDILAAAGLKIDSHTKRTVYNALWCARGFLFVVVGLHHGHFEGLALPTGPDGKVLKKVVKTSAERKNGEPLRGKLSGYNGNGSSSTRARLERMLSFGRSKMSSGPPGLEQHVSTDGDGDVDMMDAD